MRIDARTLAILACPLCKGQLLWQATEQELICRADKLAFPVRDGMPMLLTTAARQLSSTDLEQLAK